MRISTLKFPDSWPFPAWDENVDMHESLAVQMSGNYGLQPLEKCIYQATSATTPATGWPFFAVLMTITELVLLLLQHEAKITLQSSPAIHISG